MQWSIGCISTEETTFQRANSSAVILTSMVSRQQSALYFSKASINLMIVACRCTLERPIAKSKLKLENEKDPHKLFACTF